MPWANNVFQLLIVTAGSGFTGIFVYSPGPGPNNLIASVAASPGTDPYGNAYLAGITDYLSGSPAAQLNSGALLFRSISSVPALLPRVESLIAAVAGTELHLASGKGTAGATEVGIQLVDSLEDSALGGTGVAQMIINAGVAANPLTSALLEVQGSINTTSLASITAAGALQASTGDVIISLGKLSINAATTPAQPGGGIILYANSAGFTKTRPSASGDTSQYTAGHTITPNTSAVNIVSGSFTNWFGGQGVAAANYQVEAHLIATIGGTGTALIFQLTGPAVGANTAVKWWLTIESGTGQSVFAGHSLGSLASVTLPSGTVVGAGGVCHIWMSAYLQFTASGTLNLQAETTVAASTATGAIGGTLEVYPA